MRGRKRKSPPERYGYIKAGQTELKLNYPASGVIVEDWNGFSIRSEQDGLRVRETQLFIIKETKEILGQKISERDFSIQCNRIMRGERTSAIGALAYHKIKEEAENEKNRLEPSACNYFRKHNAKPTNISQLETLNRMVPSVASGQEGESAVEDDKDDQDDFLKHFEYTYDDVQDKDATLASSGFNMDETDSQGTIRKLEDFLSEEELVKSFLTSEPEQEEQNDEDFFAPIEDEDNNPLTYPKKMSEKEVASADRFFSHYSSTLQSFSLFSTESLSSKDSKYTVDPGLSSFEFDPTENVLLDDQTKEDIAAFKEADDEMVSSFLDQESLVKTESSQYKPHKP